MRNRDAFLVALCVFVADSCKPNRRCPQPAYETVRLLVFAQ